MADGILTPCNVARSRHWFRQVTAPCNVACGSGIVTLNSPSGSTLQCDTWLWDDMPLNSPKCPPCWNSTSSFHFHTSPQSTCHYVPVCEILSKSDHPRQKKMTSCRFSRWRISAILDCRDLIKDSLKSQCTTSYRSLINTVALNCSVFEKIAVFLHFGDRQTDGQTDKRTNRWTAPMREAAVSLSRAAA